MAKKIINVGTTANDTSGDSLRSAGQIINDNFTELYNVLGGETGAPLSIVSKVLAGKGIIVSSPEGDVLVTNKTASEAEVGGIRIGNGINIDDDGIASVTVYELPKASGTILGGIKVGDRLSIDSQGFLSADPGAYSLPKATDSILGGIKIGNSLEINPSGVVNVNFGEYSLPVATDTILGAVKIGSRLTVTDGVLSADVQTVGQTPQLISGSHTLVLGLDGKLQLPSGSVYIADNYVGTVATGVDTTIYSTNGNYIRAIKMFVFAEKINNGYESQACEIIGTIDQSLNVIYTSVYGVVYTGANPLFTISSNYVLATQTFNITAQPTGADNISIRTQVTEMYGTNP